MEVFAGLFQKAAGSQGRALRRAPQGAELSLETRCPARVSIQTKNKSASADAQSLEIPSVGTVFPMSALCARSISRSAERDYFFSLVDFRRSENQKGISDSAESDSGQQCPRVRALAEQVGHSLAGKRPTGAFSGSARFEKGWRKLQFFPLTAADAAVFYPRSVCRLPAKSQHDGWVRYRSNGWSHRGNPEVQNG